MQIKKHTTRTIINPGFLEIIWVAALRHVYASSGNAAAAHNTLDTLFVENKKEPVSPFFFALVYAGLNDKATALKWLEKACEEKSGSVRYLKMEHVCRTCVRNHVILQ